MRRADRLFQIVQILRCRRKATTALYLAQQLGVTERTIYRDMQDLGLSGVPILSEAGVGYVLQKGFDLPPLMFNADEITALTLGARIVENWTDEDLAKAARSALVKTQAVLPEQLKDRIEQQILFSPFRQITPLVDTNMAQLRVSADQRRKVSFTYVSLQDQVSSRTVWPLGLFYWGSVWTLGAWCELRNAFRSFRLDRISDLQLSDLHFEDVPGRNLESLVAQACQ